MALSCCKPYHALPDLVQLAASSRTQICRMPGTQLPCHGAMLPRAVQHASLQPHRRAWRLAQAFRGVQLDARDTARTGTAPSPPVPGRAGSRQSADDLFTGTSSTFASLGLHQDVVAALAAAGFAKATPVQVLGLPLP